MHFCSMWIGHARCYKHGASDAPFLAGLALDHRTLEGRGIPKHPMWEAFRDRMLATRLPLADLRMQVAPWCFTFAAS